MALELVYTSAARGLRQDTGGFCTVAVTRGMPPALIPRLEALSGYRPASWCGATGDTSVARSARPGDAPEDPVALSFWRLETGQGVVNVLTRVAATAPDHTQRSNKLATYLVLGAEEQSDAGPAWMLQHIAMRSTWEGPARWLEDPVHPPRGPAPVPAPCRAWQEACGDAGWAGVLVSAFLRDMSLPVHVIYRSGTDALALIAEAALLMPPWARWRATFTTYFMQPVAGAPCCWRFCLQGTPAAEAARTGKGLVIDLTQSLGAAPESRHVRAARTGVLEEPPRDLPGATTRSVWGDGGARDGRGQPFERSAQMGEEEAPYELAPEQPEASPSWARGSAGADGEETLAGRLLRNTGIGGARGPREAGAELSGDDPSEEGGFLGRMRGHRRIPLVPGSVALLVLVVVVLTVILVMRRGSAPTSPGPAATNQGKSADADPPAPVPVNLPAPPPPPAPTPPVAPAPPVAPPVDSPAAAPSAPPVAPAPAPPPPPEDPSSAAHPADALTPDVPWLLLKFEIAGELEQTATGALPLGMKVDAAEFALPAALRQAGVMADGNGMQLPTGTWARAECRNGQVHISVPVHAGSFDGLSGIIQLPQEAFPVEFARALLRRVPVRLYDGNGTLVAQARVEGPVSVVRRTGSNALRVPLRVMEPAVRVVSSTLSREGETKDDDARLVPGESVQLQGETMVTVKFTPNGEEVEITPGVTRMDRLEQERERLTAAPRAWANLIDDARRVAGGSRVSEAAQIASLNAVNNALNDAERNRLTDAKGQAHLLGSDAIDPQIQQQVLTSFLERCQLELDDARKELKRFDARHARNSRLDQVQVIHVFGQDGMHLASCYPEGMPR